MEKVLAGEEPIDSIGIADVLWLVLSPGPALHPKVHTEPNAESTRSTACAPTRASNKCQPCGCNLLQIHVARH